MNTTNSTGSVQSFNLHDREIPTETRECERCGEEYVDLKILADLRAICPDCTEPMGMDLGRFKPIGVADSRPFMEFGPLSHDPP